MLAFQTIAGVVTECHHSASDDYTLRLEEIRRMLSGLIKGLENREVWLD
jgi:hypothetical protein